MKLFNKKITVLIMALVIAFTCAFSTACDGGDDETDGKDVTYTVTVERSGGDPFRDMLVVVLGTNYLGRTDSDGKFSFTAPKGTYNLAFDVPDGYVGQASSYTVSTKAKTKKFTLSASLIETPATSATKYEIGSVMHDFSFVDSTGKAGTLSGVLAEKKAVLLNFWFAGCGPCVTEFPDLQEVYSQYSDDIEVLAFSRDENAAEVEAFRNNVNNYSSYGWDELTFRMIDNTQSISTALLTRFGVSSWPTSIMVDREGVVCFTASGIGTLEDFQDLFARYSADDYVQYIYFPEKDVVEKPNIPAPSASRIAQAINGEGFTAEYYPDYGEYNWPWIIGEDGKSIQASNVGKKSSHALLYADFTAEVGQILAFDYKVGTEKDADIFGVFIDGELMHTYSGFSGDEYKTCYAYVPLSSGKHTLGLAYNKDETSNAHGDVVSVKNMRFVDSVGERTEILYRCAWGSLTDTSTYSEHVNVYYNENDGYYHVGGVNGPLVVADLTNAVKPSWASSAWGMIENAQNLMYDSDGDGTEEDLLPAFGMYTSIASNSKRKGKTGVTKELKTALDALVVRFGDGKPFDENEWLDLCYYYTVYAGEEGEIAPDPSEGLAIHNAFPSQITAKGETLIKNHVNKDRVLMPRGIYYEIKPQKTAVYRLRTVGDIDSEAWLYAANGNTIAENDNDPNGDLNDGNFYITTELESGKSYYLALDFKDIDTTGEFDFVVEEMGDSGTVWTVGATGPYSFPVNEEGEQIGDYFVVGAVDYIVGADGCYHVKNADGSVGPLLYINLLGATALFPDGSVENMLKIGDYYCGGYYCMNCGIKYAASIKTFEDAEEVACWCGNTDKDRFEIKKSFELPTAIEDEKGNVLTYTWTIPDANSGFDMVTYVPYYDLNTDKDIQTDADYSAYLREYGIKFIDYTDLVEDYVNQAKNANNNPFDDDELGEHSGQKYAGYIPAHQDLIDVIQKFIVFGDYSMSPQIKNAWLMMCCYFKPLGK